MSTLTARTQSALRSMPFSVPGVDLDQFGRLPLHVRDDVHLGLRIMAAVAAAGSVQSGCRTQAALLHGRRGWSAASIARKFYSYARAGGDWRALVDLARAPEARAALFGDDDATAGLPPEFVEFWRLLCGSNKRKCKPAYRKLLRIWRTGHDDQGKPMRVPGYGTWQEWWSRQNPEAALPVDPPLPRGWSYHNLMRQEYKLTRAQTAFARIGTSAAREHTPVVLTTREGLRFLEQVQFDDVKVDFRVIADGQVCDLWLLVAVDRATDLRLGYGMRPARARDDGSQEHLKLSDMKSLCGFVLERWGLPPYPVTWKIEHGTATLAEATAEAVNQLTSGGVRVSYSSMIGGKSAAGYQERAIGNSRAKATLEAGNNLLHNEAGDLAGQTGRRYDVRPADLAARESEARKLLEVARNLDEKFSRQMRYPILGIDEARRELNRIFGQINNRTEHDLEGFAEVWEWRRTATDAWQPMSAFPEVSPEHYETRRRKESPLERMWQLTHGLEWRHVAPSVIVSFYESTQRIVSVAPSGEILFTVSGRDLVFRVPDGGETILPGTKLLAYHHPAEPDFLHLTRMHPHCGFVATWIRRERVRLSDEKGMRDAIHYTAAALKAQTDAVRTRHAGELTEADDRRAHNERVAAAAVTDFVPTIAVHKATITTEPPTAAALAAAREAMAATRQVRADAAQEESARVDALGAANIEAVLGRQPERNEEPQPDIESIL